MPKIDYMETIRISPEEEILFRELNEGNSVQIRVSVGPGEEKQYAKGQNVRVVCGESEAKGRIVSDPLVVQPGRDGGRDTIALVVESQKHE